MAKSNRPRQRLPEVHIGALSAEQQARVRAWELSVRLNRTDATFEQKMQIALWIHGEGD